MIRKINSNDKAEYIRMALEFYNSSAVSHSVPVKHHEDAFEHMVSEGVYLNGYIFEYDGNYAGFGVIAKTYSAEAGGMVIWIEDLYVRPDFQGKGIGSEFFERIKEDNPTAARWRLEITEDNTGAKRLYERCGFEVCPYIPMIREFK